ncbi:anthranilate synthase component II [Chitinophaga solisilvae]|uniref:anthranilate synthase component II n=1 Tax=Chitinophaga solisilvae TaxID=1233460 RepID=UPI00137051A7|nr:aminodeoxychorismate/anthranilate synthase component II [Chitinophaga solisilvae]
MKILVLDNYDSFTYNLVHIIRELGYGAQTSVVRNRKISLEEVDAFDKILLSPGPGVPAEAGIMMDLIRRYAPVKSILGICLGHQGICEAFGATLTNMHDVVHGVGLPTTITQPDDYLFQHIPEQFVTGRYHSWVADLDSIRHPLEVTAVSEDNYLMGVRHHSYDVRGLQFHPESVLTAGGKQLIANWLESPPVKDTSREDRIANISQLAYAGYFQ